MTMLLGYVAYGLSIFFYIKAQRDLGAAKTSAYYAIAPFVGAFFSVIVLKERISTQYVIALIFMFVGSAIATVDTLMLHHKHTHTHLITHTHDGVVHTHEITHCHKHYHLTNEDRHSHTHKSCELKHSHSI